MTELLQGIELELVAQVAVPVAALLILRARDRTFERRRREADRRSDESLRRCEQMARQAQRDYERILRARERS